MYVRDTKWSTSAQFSVTEHAESIVVALCDGAAGGTMAAYDGTVSTRALDSEGAAWGWRVEQSRVGEARWERGVA